MQLLLIRHAQSANNALPIEQRIADPPLTEIGEQQAQRLAETLADVGITHLVTSPFLRTLQTTAAIQRTTDLCPAVWSDLHEQGGCFSGYSRATYAPQPGMSISEIRRHFGALDFQHGVNEQGWWRGTSFESLDDAALRADAVVERTRKQFAGMDNACVAFVTHGTFLRILLRSFLGVGQKEPARLGQAHNTAWSILRIEQDAAYLESWNITSHLPAELLTDVGGILERI